MDETTSTPTGTVSAPASRLRAIVAVAVVLVLGTAGWAWWRVDATRRQVRVDIASEIVTSGVEHQKAGRLDAAEVLYKEALRVSPDLPLAVYDLGTLYRERGELEVAEYWFMEALRLDPTSQPSRANLDAVVAGLQGSTDVQHDALMRAGLRSFFEDRDADRAIALFRAVLAKNPSHYGATFQVARALDEAGRKSEADPLWLAVESQAEALGDAFTLDWARKRLGKAPAAP